MEFSTKKIDDVELNTHIVGGVRHRRQVTPRKVLQDLQTFEIRTDDVVVITYPKSGTTWMQEIVSVLRHNCDFQKADQDFMRERFMFLDHQIGNEIAPYIKAKTQPSPRLLKTHLQKHQLPPQIFAKKAKVIFVSRNPKDTAVSYFNFHLGVVDLPKYTWQDFLHSFCIGDVVYGSWFEMNAYWWSQRKQKHVLFVKYEEMHQDLSSVILKVSKFLGWPVPDGKLADIVLHCSFDSMKSNRKVNFSEHPLMNIESYPFMRKGIVGDWIHYFTKTQTEKFDELYEHKMQNTGLQFEYISKTIRV